MTVQLRFRAMRTSKMMSVDRRVAALAAALAAGAGSSTFAQVKTNVPDPVAGARPAIVERIKIHGKALEGNLEGDAVDRDAIVFLPPGYNQNRLPPLPGRLRAARIL